MNFKTLVSSLVVSLSLTAAASAQWSNSSGGINIGEVVPTASTRLARLVPTDRPTAAL